jgi:hypothetical protein
MIHLQWGTTASPDGDAVSPAEDAVSPAGDLLASPNSGTCDTTRRVADFWIRTRTFYFLDEFFDFEAELWPAGTGCFYSIVCI